MSKSDMFLKVEGARSGPIKGESRDDARKDEIDVLAWSWGMQARTEMGGAGTTTKSSLREMLVSKRVDSASTPLMSAMRNNDLITKATLTVRKAGKAPLDYFTVTMENGRITSIDVESVGEEQPVLIERLSLSFQKISIEYVPQGEDGMGKGAMLFETETL
ncbi:MAG: type VI secretion system tube protein Hcp [Betaproteobacteria bacterium]|nr:MAG: type VI secretion system tube protein Hcp [Betaproteobacteria bacterium]